MNPTFSDFVAGSNLKISGGLVQARFVAQSLVEQNPSGLADLSAFAPMSTGRIQEQVSDAAIKSSTEYISGTDGNPASLSHTPGWETMDSTCVSEFQAQGGSVFINSEAIRQLGAAEEVQKLIDARAAARNAMAEDNA